MTTEETTYTEYVFIQPDGTRYYEISTCLADTAQFHKMHKAKLSMAVNRYEKIYPNQDMSHNATIERDSCAIK